MQKKIQATKIPTMYVYHCISWYIIVYHCTCTIIIYNFLIELWRWAHFLSAWQLKLNTFAKAKLAAS